MIRHIAVLAALFLIVTESRAGSIAHRPGDVVVHRLSGRNGQVLRQNSVWATCDLCGGKGGHLGPVKPIFGTNALGRVPCPKCSGAGTIPTFGGTYDVRFWATGSAGPLFVTYTMYDFEIEASTR